MYRQPASAAGFWNPPPGSPKEARNLFGPSVYFRGAMTVQALRDKTGTHDLLLIMRSWVTTHRHGNGEVREFIALADQLTGRHLRGFFHRWLFRPGKP